MHATLVEQLPDAVLHVGSDGTVLAANAACRQVLGYSGDELVGMEVARLIPDDRLREMPDMCEPPASGGEPAHRFTQRRRKDGSLVDVRELLLPVTDDNGTAVAVGVVLRDATEWLRTRDELVRNERTYRARFDDVHLPQLVVALDGAITDVNDAFCLMLGLAREQLVGRRVHALRHASEPPSAGNPISRRFRKSANSTWERVLAKADGTAVPVLFHGARVPDVDGGEALALFAQDLSELKAARETLLRREALHAAMERHASEWGLLIHTENNRAFVSYASTAVHTSLGYDADEVTARGVDELIHPDDLESAQAIFSKVLDDDGGEDWITARVRHAAGSWRWVEFCVSNCTQQKHIGAVLVIGRDVTARVEADLALRASEARFRAIVQTAQEGLAVISSETGRTVFANDKLTEILGRPLDSIYSMTILELLDDKDRTFLLDRLERRARIGIETYELSYLHPDGEPRLLRITSSPLDDGNGTVASLAMVSDITAERAAEEQLRRQALYDELTGIANKTLLRDRLEHSLARAERAGSRPVAVLFADLDQFKLVNDSFGHAAGDELLRQVAERLQDVVRNGDTVARFGGDEFVIIAEDTDEPAAREMAERLLASFAEPFVVDCRRAYVTASVGVVSSPSGTVDDLLRFADAAMYDAKRRGRSRIQVFDPAIVEGATASLQLSSDLREAIEHDELELHYQPIVSLRTGRIGGVEALVRWSHATRGNVPPTEFVAVAEAMGLAPRLDEWVLRRACRDIPELRAAIGAETRVSVNISARHLSDTDLQQRVISALAGAGVGGGTLMLEITETALMADPDHARTMIEGLKAHGVRIAIDDFGTGYSSLSYLNRLPVDTLKIDRAFVENLTQQQDAMAIAASVVDLARGLRLNTVAEGVETEEQARLLHRLGCPEAQGWLWSRALPLTELVATVRSLPSGVFRRAIDRPHRAPRPDKRGIVTADHGLHEIVRLHREGASTATIAAALNAEGYRTPEEQMWHRATVARVINDTAYPELFGAGSDRDGQASETVRRFADR
jgi:diguanylate cyclase (GGDEF)-like protein/PAS domain S-box-containing protein